MKRKPNFSLIAKSMFNPRIAIMNYQRSLEKLAKEKKDAEVLEAAKKVIDENADLLTKLAEAEKAEVKSEEVTEPAS